VVKRFAPYSALLTAILLALVWREVRSTGNAVESTERHTARGLAARIVPTAPPGPREIQLPTAAWLEAQHGSATPAGPDAEDEPWLQDTVRQAVDSYQDGDYEMAIAAALDVLSQEPNEYDTERMLRIAASASCFIGQPAQARAYRGALSPRSQLGVLLECARSGVEL
jgi:hypothetical protein